MTWTAEGADASADAAPAPAVAGMAVPTGEFLPWDDPDFLLDPYPFYAPVQRDTPVYLDPAGFFVVSRYADVVEFLKSPAMSVEPGWDQAGPWSIARHTIIGHDAPEHTRLRRQTNPWFTPKLVKEWAKTTVDVTDELLDQMDGDLIDGWHELSVIPTHRTMCRILQVPDDDAGPVKVAMERSMPMLRVRTRPGEIEMAAESFAFLHERTLGFIEEKQKAGGDGLMDALLANWADGQMSEVETVSLLALLYGLGHMDVGYGVAAALYAMARHPEVFAEFRDNPEIRDSVVNEAIRLDPPELSVYRTTTTDVRISGVDIPAGSLVRYMIGAANRDPEAFDDPNVLDHTRPMERSHNLSFGIGLHSCAGQVLSRAEIRAVLECVASRYRRIDLAGDVVMQNNDFSRHFKALPLRLVS